MDKLICLGTGAAMNYKDLTTALLLHDQYGYFLLDTGHGAQVLNHLDKAGIDFSQLNHVFISHAHTDHILGAPWLMRISGHGLQRYGTWKPLTFYGSEETLSILRTICTPILPKSIVALFDSHILFQPVNDQQTLLIDDRKVTFFNIKAQKEEQFGLYTPLSDGSGLCFLGDEPLTQAGETYATKSRHLIHEAFCIEGDPLITIDPKKIGHSTVEQASENANRMHNQHLILFHSTEACSEKRKQAYQTVAKKYFSGRIDVPNDLDVLDLTF